jgi:polygalacturonase
MIITNSRIDVGDDCIAIKSGRDLQGRRIGRPTENLIIKDCLMLRGVSGVAVGSEQSGGVRNVSISNCIFNGTDRGIYLKSTRGRGGIVENIHFNNITLINIQNEAVLITLFYSELYNHTRFEEFSDRTPTFRNIEMSKISGNANNSIVILGLPESPIENIRLSNININIKAKGGLIVDNTKNLTINELIVNTMN